MNFIKNFFINHKNEIKYKDIEFESIKYVHNNGKNEKVTMKHTYTITGIGKKAIKYQKDHGEDEFIFYDNRDIRHISEIIMKSFDNEYWNRTVRQAIAAQQQYCKEHKAPHFAPEDGFCYSCGKQIYVDGRDVEYASKNLITGCPHCHRSYCD